MKRDRSQGFEGLEVYRISEELADGIWEAVIAWDNFARDTVGKQLVRAADSIGANIAEGRGKGSFLEGRRGGHIARGSLEEVRHFLRRAYRRKLLTPAQSKRFAPLLESLSPLMNGYLRSLNQRARRPAKRPIPNPQYPIPLPNA